jgi:hypothetical protein
MKPYDQVFLYDAYNDLAGPIEVEQVTHIFSQETGFVTVITPDLVVQCNEVASMAMLDALASYFTATWIGYNKPAFNSGQVGAMDLGDIPWYGMPDSGVLKVKGDVADKALSAAGAASTLVPLAVLTGGAVIYVSAIAAFCGLCMFEWARGQFPIRVTPLVWKGRPFVCGLDGFTIDSAWGRAKDGAYRAFQGIGDFFQQAGEALKDIF